MIQNKEFELDKNSNELNVGFRPQDKI
jgi:hypothetical protein